MQVVSAFTLTDPIVTNLNSSVPLQPETIYQTYRTYTKQKLFFPEILVKLHMYHILRGLNYLHSVGM